MHLSHAGLSVANLDRSVGFYRHVFNMRVVIQGPFAGMQYESVLELRGAAGRAALLESEGSELQIELFEFAHPQPKPGDPQRLVCDHGITHFCIEVPDIDAEYRRMRAAGVIFHAPPVEFLPSRNKATYGRDPDGNVFELWEKARQPHGHERAPPCTD